MSYYPSYLPRALSPADASKFLQLQVLRVLIACLLTLFLFRTVDFGIHPFWLISAVLGGTLFAGTLLKIGRSFLKILGQHALLFIIVTTVLSVLNFIVTGSPDSKPETDFLVPRFSDDMFLIFAFYVAAFLSTWLFWTRKQAVTFEAVVCSALFVWLLSAHRNYHIDAPRQISSLTWRVGVLQRMHVEPQHLFLTLGAAFIVLLALYFVLASNRPIIGGDTTIKSQGPTQKLLLIVCPFILLIALYYYGVILNSKYNADLSRVSNGVGASDAAKEGDSNLGFHQAISPTKQPAALLRLEGDYAKNPWAPMLYLREGALSTFSGQELVAAGPDLDTDIPRVQPGQPYISLQEEPGPYREKVMQSVYLLTSANVPFAIDLPKRIAPIENPYPDRFRMAYQALSYAPTTPIDQLVGLPTGEPTWDAKTWEHYLRAPGSNSIDKFVPESVKEEALESDTPVFDTTGEDLRYLALSKKLVEGIDDPVTKAAAIVEYLSDQSIYTRSPGHQATQKGDPVAPYLFSKEKRGYCVHFSHAAVYLLRLAGVPARIATGYLTDLTYAKDGHILLHLGDRHAWPEIYVEGHGWMVFDITPARAENEQQIVPDEKLLDELMSKLNPIQELLDPVPLDTSEEQKNALLDKLLTPINALALGFSVFLGLLLRKLWLRFGYRVSKNERKRVRRAYTSFASLMTDLGLRRQAGETRKEFSDRLHSSYGIDSKTITYLNELNTYANRNTFPPSDELKAALQTVVTSYDKSRSKYRRYLAFLNPSSLSKYRTW